MDSKDKVKREDALKYRIVNIFFESINAEMYMADGRNDLIKLVKSVVDCLNSGHNEIVININDERVVMTLDAPSAIEEIKKSSTKGLMSFLNTPSIMDGIQKISALIAGIAQYKFNTNDFKEVYPDLSNTVCENVIYVLNRHSEEMISCANHFRNLFPNFDSLSKEQKIMMLEFCRGSLNYFMNFLEEFAERKVISDRPIEK